MQNDIDIFQNALEIEDPWFISYREFDKDKGELHLFLNFPRGAMFNCSYCKTPSQKVHDIINESRTWRHLDFCNYKTYIHARLPRTKCALCRKTHSVRVSWSRPRNYFTWHFESYVLSLMKEMPVAAVAR